MAKVCFTESCTYNTSYGGHQGNHRCGGDDYKYANCLWTTFNLIRTRKDDLYDKLSSVAYNAQVIQDMDTRDAICDLVHIIQEMLEEKEND